LRYGAAAAQRESVKVQFTQERLGLGEPTDLAQQASAASHCALQV